MSERESERETERERERERDRERVKKFNEGLKRKPSPLYVTKLPRISDTCADWNL